MPLHPLLPSPTCISPCRSIGDTLCSNDSCLAPPSFSFSSVTLLSCSWTPSSFRHFFNTLLRHLVHPLLRHTLTPPPPFPIIWRRSSEEMSHLQPRWKRTLSVTSPSSSSVTVWTLMKKRWVLSYAPIYLSGQGTCTLIPASLSLPLLLSCLTPSLSSSLSWYNAVIET